MEVCMLIYTMAYAYIVYIGKGTDNPLWYSCLGDPMVTGAWWATVMGSQRLRHNWAHSTHTVCWILF